MLRIPFDDAWPESWKYSYPYDLLEIYGEMSHRGYAYAYQVRRRVTLDLITRVLPPGARILDVAAAQGNLSLTLAEMGYDVTWNDLRGDLAGYVQLKRERGSVAYAPGNIFDLRFPRPFDAVLIAEIIEHVAHPDLLLRAVGNLVKEGGYVVMTTPNGSYFRNRLPRFSECEHPEEREAGQFRPNADGHIFLLHPDELARLATASGLAVERLLFFTNPLTHGHLGSERLLRRLPSVVVDAIERGTQRLPRRLQRVGLLHMAARFKRWRVASTPATR
jgi:2-polyprenyl-6-hydroxyphenyl methylase/3-demethylubiquinone-9 3-methyltransferase